MYLCPVCGYSSLPRPADDYLICPSCGVEFGYDDSVASHEELRKEWIEKGMPWAVSSISKPEGWNPVEQILEFIGILSVVSLSSIGEEGSTEIVQERPIKYEESLEVQQISTEFLLEQQEVTYFRISPPTEVTHA